ncbi:capZ-interacting protein isoform X2 [Lemur catta]|uniref:capZ-interacting protein isoform X2 n=1 Tax=Lemur catta TaxID=9447 RepID=UPI001E266C48|nr:capZ-interacting protein isoform X2 [Lemur catta]
MRRERWPRGRRRRVRRACPATAAGADPPPRSPGTPGPRAGQSRSRAQPGARRSPTWPGPEPRGQRGSRAPAPSERARQPRSRHLKDMEERLAEPNANVDNSASPSVAQLAGRFREQAAAAREKSPPNASHAPKIKVKSSPLIEKLQANLTFDPAALLPGASPKSPGLKAMVSPFHSPPSTPSSPGVRSRPSEAEEVPVSFDQPPEGSHLPCYNKVRTRGSIKRRPPSRRFRRSQSDCGDLGEYRASESSQENGATEQNGDEVFPPKSKAPGAPSSGEGAAGEGVRSRPEPSEKPPLRRASSRTEKPEKDGAAEEGDGAREQAPAQTSSPGTEDGRGSPREGEPAGEEPQAAKATEAKEEREQNEEARPGPKSQDTQKPEEGAVGEGTPESSPGGVEGHDVPKPEKDKQAEEEGAALEPGCSPGSGHAQPEPSSEAQGGRMSPTVEGDTPVQDTKM